MNLIFVRVLTSKKADELKINMLNSKAHYGFYTAHKSSFILDMDSLLSTIFRESSYPAYMVLTFENGLESLEKNLLEFMKEQEEVLDALVSIGEYVCL